MRGDGTRELSSRLAKHDLAHAVTGVAAAVRRVAFLTSVLVTEVRVTAARTPAEVAAAADAHRHRARHQIARQHVAAARV